MMEHLLISIISQLLPRLLLLCSLRCPRYSGPLLSLLSPFLLTTMRTRPPGVALDALTHPRPLLGPLNPFTALPPVVTRFGPNPLLVTAHQFLNSILGLTELLLPLIFILAPQDLHRILNAANRLLLRWLLGLGPLADLLGVPMSTAPRP